MDANLPSAEPVAQKMRRLPMFAKKDGADRPSPLDLPYQRHVLRRGRAIRRLLWVLLITPVSCVIQALLLVLPGEADRSFAKFYWASIARALGLAVRVVGAPAGTAGGRRVIYVCNHSSWLDVAALGGQIKGCFVAKDDVSHWPGISTIARLGRTIFVSRSRQNTKREGDAMTQRLRDGDDLILFPEGTSSDGSRVLPFRSAFFSPAFGEEKPLIQPVSIVYDRLGGLPMGRVSRSVLAWYGDMTLVPHAFEVAQCRGKRVSILFHAPVDPADFADRKALAVAVQEIVAQGAAALRQNRPMRAQKTPSSDHTSQNYVSQTAFA